MKKIKQFLTGLFLTGLFTVSNLSFAQGVITNPLKGLTSIPEFVSSLLSFVAQVGAVFAVLALIWVGFLYVQARGNPGAIGKAHTAFKNTIIGIILLLGAQLIASVITGTIGALTR
jgi:hypothetical protein